MTELNPGAAPEPHAGVETAFFDTEAVLYDERTGMIHRLNPAASAVWLALDGLADRTTIVDELVQLFGTSSAEVAGVVDAALVEFERLGVLAGSDPGAAPDIEGDAGDEQQPSLRVLARPPDP
ncbi:MAG: PqqD family protein [Actinomycetota bacterium]|nr:PqqD family protein [Actinomycetota bacterium]